MQAAFTGFKVYAATSRIVLWNFNDPLLRADSLKPPDPVPRFDQAIAKIDILIDYAPRSDLSRKDDGPNLHPNGGTIVND